MAERSLILRGDEGVPLHSMMDQEIASVINRALSFQKALANIPIMKVKTNAIGAMMPATHQNAMAAMALVYCVVIINAAHMVKQGVIDIEEN
jgi:hypothetical protein